jgi:hypothetical protein
MRTKRNSKKDPTGLPLTTARHGHFRYLRMAIAATAAGLAGAAVLVMALVGVLPWAASAGAATAGAVGFPGARSSGVPTSTALQTVPGQVSKGAGWGYDSGGVEVTGNNAVLSGLSISSPVNISGSHVTIKNCKIVTGGTFGVVFRHTSGTTIVDNTISGLDAGSGRVNMAVDDAYGDSTGTVVQDNDISLFKNGVQLSAGLVSGNYIHDPGYISGDHTNGLIANGGTGKLTISHNTILNSLTQTDAITINTSTIAGPVSNKTITNNLLGGAGFVIYGGTGFGHATSNIVITNNQFSQRYYPKSGQFGPVLNFDSKGPGNVWTGNVYATSRATIPAP